jgi:predicted permease
MGVLDEPRSIAIARDGLTTRWQAIGRLDEAILTPIPRGRSWYSPQPDARLRLVALFVLLILVIGCLNVSTLLGAGVHQRSRELAIRASLGAGRIRLLRQLLAEHLMLAAVGGVVGGVVGVWMARGLATLMHSRFTPGDVDVTPDGYVVLFTIAVSLVTGLAVGVTPAVRWSKVRALSALQGGGTGITRMTRSASLWWLIPGQVALGTVLLASAGVLVQTVHNLKGGIETTAPERVWFADLQGDGAPVTAAGFDDYQARLRAHLRTLGGVESASVATGRPLASLRRGPLRVEGMTVVPDSRPMPWGPPPPPPPRGHAPLGKMWIVSSTYCTPDFFASLALPIVRGRDFTNADGAGAPRVAIVNETLAARAFGKADPVGKRVGWAGGDAFDIEIVGVVRDLRSEDLRAAAPDAIFFPLPQIPRGETVDPTATGAARRIDLTIVLRAADERTLNREQVLRHVTAFDPRAFVDRIATFDEEAGRTLSQERLLAWVGSTLGAIALALLIVGLYGTLTAAVVRSRRELGIRLALGATPRAVRSIVVIRSVGVVLVGLALGLPLSYLFTKSFAHLLYGVQPIEPIVVAVIVGAVLTTALAAAYLPARLAGRVDPVVALKGE